MAMTAAVATFALLIVRERDECSYAICLSHEGRVKHYRIDILPSGNFAIQDGPKFESIIALLYEPSNRLSYSRTEFGVKEMEKQR
ncbi:hypothetical protein TYRP_011726 [Tyrophagus putrescentiae]|nr:hypothetical protein TYRP_011726 [Tyrophagus putrescentiae]